MFSSHHMTDVERIGGRIVLLSEGKVAMDRHLDRIREDLCIAMVPADNIRCLRVPLEELFIELMGGER